MSEVIYQSRKEAKKSGGKTYQGKPCKKCGGTQRWVSSYSCVQCVEVRRDAFSLTPKRKAWLKLHRQTPKAKAYNQAYELTPKTKARRKAYLLRRRQSPMGRAQMLFVSTKSRAKKTGLPFTITRESVERLLLVADQKWAQLGFPFDYTSIGRKAFTPSIDQIKAGEGYTPGNIQIVPWFWNAFKNDYFTDAEAIQVCVKIADAHRRLTA